MTNTNRQNLEIVEIDTVWSKLPKSFYDLKPTIYKDGTAFYCFFGLDDNPGIFGSGSSPEDAVRDWDDHLNEVLRSQNENVSLIEYILACVGHSKYQDTTLYKGEF
jgi:hypothetical protein